MRITHPVRRLLQDTWQSGAQCQPGHQNHKADSPSPLAAADASLHQQESQPGCGIQRVVRQLGGRGRKKHQHKARPYEGKTQHRVSPKRSDFPAHAQQQRGPRHPQQGSDCKVVKPGAGVSFHGPVKAAEVVSHKKALNELIPVAPQRIAVPGQANGQKNQPCRPVAQAGQQRLGRALLQAPQQQGCSRYQDGHRPFGEHAQARPERHTPQVHGLAVH